MCFFTALCRDLKALELAGPINWDALAVLSMMQLLDLSSNGG